MKVFSFGPMWKGGDSADKAGSSRKNSLWQQRKESGVYRKMAETRPLAASMQEYVDRMNAEAGSLLDKLSRRASFEKETVLAKLKSGQSLSGSELEHLRQTDPASYQKAKQLEAERAAYERQLKQCKTKEDVERLRMSKLSSSMAAVSAIANNPNIPEEKKLEMLEQERMRVNAINNETNEFVKSTEYAKLPTDAERNEKMRVKGRMEKTAESTDAAKRLQLNEKETGEDIAGEEDISVQIPQESSDAAEATEQDSEFQPRENTDVAIPKTRQNTATEPAARRGKK